MPNHRVVGLYHEGQKVSFFANRFLRAKPGDFRSGFYGFVLLFSDIRAQFWEIRADLCPVLLAQTAATGRFSRAGRFGAFFLEGSGGVLNRLMNQKRNSRNVNHCQPVQDIGQDLLHSMGKIRSTAQTPD